MRAWTFLLLGMVAAIALSCSADDTVRAAPADLDVSVVSAALAMRDEQPPTIRIESPTEGATVTSPVSISIEATGFSLAKAGRVVDGEGHLHYMIDTPCLASGTVMPKDAAHVHVGSGSNEVELELPPGPHSICVQVGDGFHTAVAIIDTIDLIVVEDAGAS